MDRSKFRIIHVDCVYIFVVLIIAAVSNGANLTDGLDGLAAGSSAIIVLTLGVLRGCQEISSSQII